MALKLLLLGRLRDVAGWREREFGLAPARLSALREQLGREDQALGESSESSSAPPFARSELASPLACDSGRASGFAGGAAAR